MNQAYDSNRKQPIFERKQLGDMSERELLERLFEMTCPSCDKEMIQQAAVETAEDKD